MADWIKLRTHVANHVRFIKAGAAARDLYVWGMLWSGQQETDGEIPMEAILASPWGHGNKRNVTLAQKLVEVGLWGRTDTGYRVLKWSEQGNQTKAEIEARRAGDRSRKAPTSSPPPPTSGGLSGNLPHGIPYSSSYSSGSRSPEGVQGEGPPSVTPPGLSHGPPDWFGSALETVEMQTGERVRPADAWLRYSGHRRNKSLPLSQSDAVYWLTTVMVPEARKERRDEADKRERDARFERQRGAPPEPIRETKEQAKALAAELAARVAARKASERGAA